MSVNYGAFNAKTKASGNDIALFTTLRFTVPTSGTITVNLDVAEADSGYGIISMSPVESPEEHARLICDRYAQ
jgi:hypothetical protein